MIDFRDMEHNQNRIMVPSRKPTSCLLCHVVGHTKPRCLLNKSKPVPLAGLAQVARAFDGLNSSYTSSVSVPITNNVNNDDDSDYATDSGDDEYQSDDDAIREYQQAHLDPVLIAEGPGLAPNSPEMLELVIFSTMKNWQIILFSRFALLILIMEYIRRHLTFLIDKVSKNLAARSLEAYFISLYTIFVHTE